MALFSSSSSYPPPSPLPRYIVTTCSNHPDGTRPKFRGMMQTLRQGAVSSGVRLQAFAKKKKKEEKRWGREKRRRRRRRKRRRRLYTFSPTFFFISIHKGSNLLHIFFLEKPNPPSPPEYFSFLIGRKDAFL